MKINGLLFIIATALLFSCSKDDDSILPEFNSADMENQKIELKIGESIQLCPKINTTDVDYIWTENGVTVSTTSKYIFNSEEVGTFKINYIASNNSGEVTKDYTIIVIKIRETNGESSAYLSDMFEYKPAPGQFINAPALGDIEGAESILGEIKTGMVSLGGFGGYIKLGFDHTILNTQGEDIAIYGNAFDGSSEPAIVMVSFDYNANGQADDEWFELAGSEYNAEKTIHNYEITYTNPNAVADVSWKDNQGNTGFIKQNQWNNHTYYPEFVENQKSIRFTGTLIENKTDLHHKHPVYGSIVYNPAREWGYADNFSDEYLDLKANKFDIEWAVDSEGKKVKLPGVDFIKIYTATNADGGWLGEVSAEIMGAADISLL